MCEYHILPVPGRQGHFSKAFRTEEQQPYRGAAAFQAETGLPSLSKVERPDFCPLARPLQRRPSQVGRRWANLCTKHQPALSLDICIAHVWTWQELLMSSLSLDFCSRNRSFKGGEGGLSDGWTCLYTNYCNFDFKEIWKNRAGSFYSLFRQKIFYAPDAFC